MAEDTGTSADGLVVVEVKPIINFGMTLLQASSYNIDFIHAGSAHIYEATVEEETMTLPFKTKRLLSVHGILLVIHMCFILELLERKWLQFVSVQMILFQTAG